MTCILGSAGLLGGCEGGESEPYNCFVEPHCIDDSDPSTALTDAEGGSIYFDYIDYSPEMAEAGFPDKAVRLIGHFVSDMDPETFPPPTGCGDLTNTPGWPTGVAKTITEVNVGSLELIGDDSTLVVEPQTGVDLISRDHDVFYQAFLPNQTDTYIDPDSAYDLHITGSPDYPETTYPGAFYFPPAFNVTSPPHEATEAPVVGDWELAWEKIDAANGEEQFQIVMLLSPDGTVIHQLCPSAHTGSYAVPENTLNTFRTDYPSGGLLLRGTVTYRLAWFDNCAGIANRRIDFASMYSYVQPFTFAVE